MFEFAKAHDQQAVYDLLEKYRSKGMTQEIMQVAMYINFAVSSCNRGCTIDYVSRSIIDGFTIMLL